MQLDTDLPHCIETNGAIDHYASQDNSALLLQVLFYETLMVPYSSHVKEMLKNFWDTDQAAFTYICHRLLKLESFVPQFGNISLLNQSVTNESIRFAGSTAQISVHLQKSLAPPLRMPFLSDFGKPELAWQPGDWMMHVSPGIPSLKDEVWTSVCSFINNRSDHPCWWTM